VLTIYFCLFLLIYVSYIWTKYSDFGYFGFYKIFQIWGIIGGMGILDNLESAWDEEFHFESKPIAETDQKGDPITWENSNQ
jgi:hypothetical protein